MKLSDKLRELLAIPTGLMAQPIDWDSVDLELSRSDAETLLAEAERLERLIVHDKDGSIVTQGAFNHAIAQRDKAIEKAERLEQQNARLRELVRSAYTESWGELSPNEYREEYWEQSAAKAALDKEGSDA